MDPITIAAVLLLSVGAWKGVDAATGGLLSAEVGGGVRGAGSYVRTAGSRRVRDARAAARTQRMKTPLGRAVQFVLDEVGALGRGLFGGWRSGRAEARTAWEERRCGEPMPIVSAWRSGRAWLDSHLPRPTDDPNGSDPEHPNDAGQDPNGTQTSTPNGDPERTPNDPDGQAPNGEPEPEREPEQTTPIKVWKTSAECGRCGADIDYATDTTCPNCGARFTSIDSVHPEYAASIQNGRPDLPVTTRKGTAVRYAVDSNPDRTAPLMHRGAVADTNSAPAVLAAWDQYQGRYEEIESLSAAMQSQHEQLENLVSALHSDVAATADGMGDFAIGGESDVVAMLAQLQASATSAREAASVLPGSASTSKEQTDAYLSALHLEYDASIEAAASKRAAAHAPMQEV